MKRTLVAISHIDEILRDDKKIMENVDEHFFPGLLSNREFFEWNCLQNPIRKREWLVARLLAKYMVLYSMAIPFSNTNPIFNQQELISVYQDDILLEDPRSLRRTELLSIVKGKGPRLFWLGKDLSIFISCSVSHSGGWVAFAFTVEDCLLGVDIERVQNFSMDFKAGCFSDRERAWIDKSSSVSGMHHEELYTLLWTLKESSFKLGGGIGFLLRTEIKVTTIMEKPFLYCEQTQKTIRMTCFELEFFTVAWHRAYAASCRVGSDYLLSIVIIENGGIKYDVSS